MIVGWTLADRNLVMSLNHRFEAKHTSFFFLIFSSTWWWFASLMTMMMIYTRKKLINSSKNEQKKITCVFRLNSLWLEKKKKVKNQNSNNNNNNWFKLPSRMKKKNLNWNIIYIKMVIKNKKLKGECREIGSHLFILFFLLIDWLIDLRWKFPQGFSLFNFFFLVLLLLILIIIVMIFFLGVGWGNSFLTYTQDKLNPECRLHFLAWFYGTNQNPFCHQTTEQQKKTIY